MGFMDKVKQAAQDVTAEAKKATAQGKEKLGEVQTKRKMDDAAKRLGYLSYAKWTKGESDAEATAAVVAEIAGYEAELAAAAEAEEPPAEEPPPSAPPEA
jgi:hypothetical protein